MKTKGKILQKLQRKQTLRNSQIFLGLIVVLPLIVYSIAVLYKTFPPPLAKNNATVTIPDEEKYVQGQIIVKYKDTLSDTVINEHLQPLNAHIKKRIEGINYIVVTVPPGQEKTVLETLSHDPLISSVGLDHIYHLQFTPNDAFFSNQWAFENTGQSIKGKSGVKQADIGLKAAWDVTKGNGVKVGVIDSGIGMNHPDLQGKVGLLKIFAGSSIDDRHGHGTHVAGIIAANTDNGEGVSGICPGCELLIAKSIGDEGSGNESTLSEAIIWSADNGAKVINLSEASGAKSQFLDDAVAYAWNKGAVIVASAGNNNLNKLYYPAASPHAIAVGATDNTDKKATFSNFGTWVHVTAPGDQIYSTLPTQPYDLQPLKNLSFTYDYLSGTSMSAPVVSGVVALIWASQYGTSNTAVVERLFSTADKIPGTGQYWTYGRINAAKAVGTTATTPTVLPTLPPTPIAPTFFCIRNGPGGCQTQN